MSASSFITDVQAVLGVHDVITQEAKQRPYTHGFRLGHGPAEAVLLPNTLWELWQALECCVRHDRIVIMQSANTGLTGGSTPDAGDYDAPVVVINTRKIKGVQTIHNNEQVIAFPGTSLTELENALKPLGREPHSVIGSSCIGASVVGGVCNNSGGSLIRRGPAFTEKALFARRKSDGTLELVNNLGIDLGSTHEPKTLFERLEKGDFTTGDAPDWEGRIWAQEYAESLRDVDSSTPTRFNGNPLYLHDASGSSGKVAVLAVRLPSFPAPKASKTIYIGTNDIHDLVKLRRHLLQNLSELPMQAEYVSQRGFEMTVRYSKHMYKAIAFKGAESIPGLFAFKSKVDRFFSKIPFLPSNMADIAIQIANRLSPSGVPKRLLDYKNRFKHHLMIKTDAHLAPELIEQTRAVFEGTQAEFIECSPQEEKYAFLIRFGVAGSTINICEYKGWKTEERLVAFDVAMPRNDEEFLMELPPHLQEMVEIECTCAHFFCFVTHQDYVIKKGVDWHAFKQAVIEYLNTRNAKYPAEHNVGHLYQASDEYVGFYKRLDPSNRFNPGLGKTTRAKNWCC